MIKNIFVKMIKNIFVFFGEQELERFERICLLCIYAYKSTWLLTSGTSPL